MKRATLFILLMILAAGLKAQHYEHLYMLDAINNNSYYFCDSEVDGVILHGQPGNCFMPPYCQSDQDQILFDTALVTRETQGWWTWLWFANDQGCSKHFCISFTEGDLPDYIWNEDNLYKCPYESLVLEAPQGNGWRYQWSNGSTDRDITVNEPGTYSVVITFCGSKEYEITVNDYDSRPVDLGPDITKCRNETVLLDAGEFESYLWSNGATGRTIMVSEAGTYQVTVADGNGCASHDEITVSDLVNPGAEIQCVTLDTTDGNNKVVWEVKEGHPCQTVQIFREFSTEQYELIGEVPYEEGSFADKTASQNQSWRYKIAAVDFCGDPSSLSDYHQNIFASVLPLANGGTVIMWTHYEGRAVSRYHIFSTQGFGERWDPQLVASVSGNVSAYNLNDPVGKHFVVAAEFNEGKQSERLSFSNLVNNPYSIEEAYAIDVQIRPVPAKNVIVISGNSLKQAEIVNLLGQRVAKIEGYGDQFTLDVSNIPAGIYFVNITDEKGGICVKKIVKR